MMLRDSLLSRTMVKREITQGNSTYGAMKDQYNNLYDPRQANNVCVSGQLLLLDLIEHLEPVCDLIQSNTDGLLIKLRGNSEKEINACFEKVDDICYEWERRSKMELEFDEFTEVWQKDVNNYIAIHKDGSVKSKGGYVKKLKTLDNDLPIVNKALIDYMVHGTAIEDTVNNCNDLIMFQKIVKLTNKYKYVVHNNQQYSEKVFRVFASTSSKDSIICKVKQKGDKEVGEKFANTPNNCFICNDDLHNLPIPSKLDRNYYIDLAKKRLNDFLGV